MKRFLTILSFSLCTTAIANASDCAAPTQVTGATFVSQGAETSQQSITMWRDTDNRVIYEILPQGITRVYLKYSEEAIAYEEYFHAERIGVEHEPSPTNVRGGWSEVANFVATTTLDALEKAHTGTYQCYNTSTYKGTIQGQDVTVTMIDELSLPVAFVKAGANGAITWELARLETSNTQAAEISDKISSYKTYDFADLGDHEDEAFFRQSGYLKYKLGHENHGEHNH